jgi:hypothetical protein
VHLSRALAAVSIALLRAPTAAHQRRSLGPFDRGIHATLATHGLIRGRFCLACASRIGTRFRDAIAPLKTECGFAHPSVRGLVAVHRSSILAFGLLVLIECVALGDENDQVDAQTVRLAEVQSYHELGDPIDGRGDSHDGSKAKADNQQDEAGVKSQIESGTQLTIARATDAISRFDLQASELQDSVCLMIEAAGRAHDLPLEFFARVIWQESRFRPDTVGPRRRNGESAKVLRNSCRPQPRREAYSIVVCKQRLSG